MKRINLIALIIAAVFFANASQAYSQNFQADLSKIDNAKFEQKFRKKFCSSSMKKQKCNSRWSNFSELLTAIKQDTRVKDIQIAAFMMATAYTETGIKDFSSATAEIKGKKNKDKDYWKPDNETGKTYFGRGWVQLTRKEKYKLASDLLGQDLVKTPDLAYKPENAYKILYSALMDGWIETYRSNIKGAAGTVPIKLTDFIGTDGKLNYALARSSINANCISCPDGKINRFEFKPGQFLPFPQNIDVSKKTKDFSDFFEKTIRESLS